MAAGLTTFISVNCIGR